MGGKDEKLLAKLGPSSTADQDGSRCLYIKRLDDVHEPTLQKLIDDVGEARSTRTSKK